MADSGIQSSFIPHDAGEVKANAVRIQTNGLSDLALLLSIVFFVASGALAGGVFLYVQYLQTATASKAAQLERAKSAFEPSLIQQLTRLDDRMHAADTILAEHVATSVFFAALSQETLATISFRSLAFQGGDGKHFSIKMEGIAQSVNSIALQAQLFSKNPVITSPIFSGIGRQPDGVHFSLSALVNPTAINYVKSLAPAPQTPADTQPVEKTQKPTQPASPFDGPGVGAQQ